MARKHALRLFQQRAGKIGLDIRNGFLMVFMWRAQDGAEQGD